jgi:hypothetical protein
MAANEEAREIGMLERLFRSRILRGIVHIHAGFSLVRSWALDIQIPHGTAVHLFDFWLYRLTGSKEPFQEWVRERELLFP